MTTAHCLFLRYICNRESVLISQWFPSAISQWVLDGYGAVPLRVDNVDVCWVLGHQRGMTEMGKHFCKLKIPWLENHLVLCC